MNGTSYNFKTIWQWELHFDTYTVANRALKFQKNANMTQKMFLKKFEYGYQNNSEFYADLESVEKNAKN